MRTYYSRTFRFYTVMCIRRPIGEVGFYELKNPLNQKVKVVWPSVP